MLCLPSVLLWRVSLFLDIPVLQCYSRYGEVISDLARFFRTERSNFPARLVTEQENNIVSTLLPVESIEDNPTPAFGQ
jgi:regulator of telomere elongation helicase 1